MPADAETMRALIERVEKAAGGITALRWLRADMVGRRWMFDRAGVAPPSPKVLHQLMRLGLCEKRIWGGYRWWNLTADGAALRARLAGEAGDAE